MAKIQLDSYARSVRIPFAANKDMDPLELDEEVEITIRGKVQSVRAEVPAGTNYKESPRQPPELEIKMTSATMNGKTNTFEAMSKKMGEDEPMPMAGH